MAGSPKRRLGRSALVLAGSLAGHLCAIWLAANALVHPLVSFRKPAEIVIPIDIAPPIQPPDPARSKPASVRPATRRKTAAAAHSFRLPPTLGAGLAAVGETVNLPQRTPVQPTRIEVTASDESASAGASGGPSYPINPGYWEVVERWLLIGRTERYCVSPETITRFIAAPCNHIYHCEYPVQTVQNGRLRFEGVIWKKDERYNVRGEGLFTPTTTHLSMSGHGHWRMLPFVFAGSLDGHFLGPDCPADAKRLGRH
jgi:hypothetical protein